MDAAFVPDHPHLFLGASHQRNERRTWTVIWLCTAMMVAEIAGGWMFGSVALIADGLHMSTHAGALLLAATAYTYARRHAEDARFSFGTGKFGDLAGYTSAIVLAMIALLIAWEAVQRLLAPVPIHYAEAIAIAVLGLGVNLVSAWMLGGEHHHGHHHHHDAHDHDHDHDHHHDHDDHHHHGHGHAHTRDNNMRAAFVHVLADAAVSVLVILGLALAWAFGWNRMDPLAGLVGAAVIASWAWGLVRDTGAILLDMVPDAALARQVRAAVEADGARLTDLHLWRLGPGHLGAILSVESPRPLPPDAYRARLAGIGGLSHVTVEVRGRESQA
jgi:cation diffusion facilitator family transporter